MVYVFRGELSRSLQRSFLGFAAGVMTAASVWSLLIPAMEMAESRGQGVLAPVGGGFVLGGLFLLALDSLLPHLHVGSNTAEGLPAHWRRSTMGVLAGTAVSLPMKSQGASAHRAFLYGAASGVVEPVFGLLTVLAAGSVEAMMPWVLSFAAGAMIYVVVEELIPEAQLGEHSHSGTLSVMGGFLAMMLLDVLLG